MTKGVSDIGATFDEFCVDLVRDRREAIEAIRLGGSGFEGWLKIEFFLWLVTRHGLTPRTEIGLEYPVPLDEGAPGVGVGPKRCDLWVMDADGLRSHYVELKAFFNNSNAGKMHSSAGQDLWYMAHIHPDAHPATGSAILVGVGFTEDEWLKTHPVLDVLKLVNKIPVSTRTGSLSDEVHWNAWVRAYR